MVPSAQFNLTELILDQQQPTGPHPQQPQPKLQQQQESQLQPQRQRQIYRLVNKTL